MFLKVKSDVEIHTINYHLKKVFLDSELQEDSVIRNFRITAADGENLLKVDKTQDYVIFVNQWR